MGSSGIIFRKTILFIFLAEILSFFGYLLPAFNQAAFFVIVALTLILSLYKLEYGVLVALAELFIGSKGYLFYFAAGEAVISIRIALWVIVMSVWISGFVIRFAKEKKIRLTGGLPARDTLLPYFAVLSVFIVWGVTRGLIAGNGYADIFFDFNGWLYLALVLPVYGIVFVGEDKEKPLAVLSRIGQIFTAAALWLALKTFFLLFVFSHAMTTVAPDIYRWVRESGVGEITDMQNGFYRIFFQSHIFMLAGFFVFLSLFLGRLRFISSSASKIKIFADRYLIGFFIMLSVMLSVTLVSFARSNWAGLLAGIVAVLAGQLWLEASARLKKTALTLAVLFCSLVLSVGLIVATVKFPYPSPVGGFNTAELLAERAGQVSGEAGVSSRWNLLPRLAEKIEAAPIFGGGFGATVTYKTSDPRALASSPDGLYTTSAFEWGWLDIWLKSGIFGLLGYLWLLAMIFRPGLTAARGLAENKDRAEAEYAGYAICGMLAGLFAVMAVNFFSPYLNHPLGFGYIILCAVVIDGLRAGDGAKKALPKNPLA